jgi:hypothetical protein
MNLKISLVNAWNALDKKDAKRLTQALGELNQSSAANRFPILASLLRGCIYIKFNDGVSALLKAGAKPCVADLSLAITERHADIVRQLLAPELLEKLARQLSSDSFAFAFQQILPSRRNDYKKAYSQISADCRTRLALWMSGR